MNQAINNNKKTINRRSFLTRAWAWLGIIAGIEFGAVTLSFLSAGKKVSTLSNPALVKTAGTIDSIPAGSVVPFKNGQFYLVRLEDGGFLALSLACTHLGCAVTFDGSKKEFICPCHASSFDLTGNVLKAPAPRALDTYRVFIENGQVKIDTSKKIRRKGFSMSDLVYA
jgi:cytochrome b6-f complex iron-sulfur subunit